MITDTLSVTLKQYTQNRPVLVTSSTHGPQKLSQKNKSFFQVTFYCFIEPTTIEYDPSHSFMRITDGVQLHAHNVWSLRHISLHTSRLRRKIHHFDSCIYFQCRVTAGDHLSQSQKCVDSTGVISISELVGRLTTLLVLTLCAY